LPKLAGQAESRRVAGVAANRCSRRQAAGVSEVLSPTGWQPVAPNIGSARPRSGLTRRILGGRDGCLEQKPRRFQDRALGLESTTSSGMIGAAARNTRQ